MVIESIRTSAKFVICSKINPKFDGVPTTDTLPLSQIRQYFRYPDSQQNTSVLLGAKLEVFEVILPTAKITTFMHCQKHSDYLFG